MTNEQMLALALNRTRAFYERVYKPAGLASEAQLKQAETLLKKSFASARSPSDLAFAFLRDFEKAETAIVCDGKVPGKFKDEIDDIRTTWLADRVLKQQEDQNRQDR